MDSLSVPFTSQALLSIESETALASRGQGIWDAVAAVMVVAGLLSRLFWRAARIGGVWLRALAAALDGSDEHADAQAQDQQVKEQLSRPVDQDH